MRVVTGATILLLAGCTPQGGLRDLSDKEAYAFATTLCKEARAGDTNRVKGMLDEHQVSPRNMGKRANLLFPALAVAAGKGDLPMVQLLVRRGASIDGPPPACDYRGWTTPLHNAVSGRHREVTRFLMDHGADANQLGYGPPKAWVSYQSPLDLAVGMGDKGTVALLLDRGAGPGFYTLRRAAWKGNHDIANLLIARGAEVDLHSAAGLGMVDNLRKLLAGGASVVEPTFCGVYYDETILHYAARGGSREAVELLIRHGADVKAEAEPHGYTAVDTAATYNHWAIVKLLIQHGASPSFGGWDDDFDPLNGAISRKDVDDVRMIVDAGCSLDHKDEKGKTPLISAVSVGHFDIVTILLAAGVDVNAKAKNGMTALMAGCENAEVDADQRRKIVGLLLAKGADVNHKDAEGRTALSLAKANGFKDIVLLLRQHGATP